MTTRASVVIIDSHLLVRGALESLIEGHSYRVVCSLNSISEIGDVEISGAPKLVILSEQSVNDAISGANEIRRTWQDSKVVWLFEQLSAGDVQRLLDSVIDGCVPLCASTDALIHTLDVILSGEERVMFFVLPQHLSIQPQIPDAGHSADDNTNGAQAVTASSEFISVASVVAAANATARNANGTADSDALIHAENGAVTANGNSNGHGRQYPHLSEREKQILDSLVKGHANKVIARTYDITEATVKVHMKSVLRKIQVANRTQAAIWALEHGFSTDEIQTRLMSAAAE